jgi:hypothetical protein
MLVTINDAATDTSVSLNPDHVTDVIIVPHDERKMFTTEYGVVQVSMINGNNHVFPLTFRDPLIGDPMNKGPFFDLTTSKIDAHVLKSLNDLNDRIVKLIQDNMTAGAIK